MNMNQTILFNDVLTRVKSLLLGQERLDRRQVPSEVLALDVDLLVRDPRLDNVGLPHKLQVGRVVQQPVLAPVGQGVQVVQLGGQLADAREDRVGVVVARRDELVPGGTNLAAAVAVDGEVGLERFVLLQEALDAGHRVSVVVNSQQLLLLAM